MVRVQSVQGEGFRGIRYSELLMGFGFGRNRLAGWTSYRVTGQMVRMTKSQNTRLLLIQHHLQRDESRDWRSVQSRFTVCLRWPGEFDSSGSTGMDHCGPPWVVCPDPLDRELWKNVVYWLQLSTLLNIIHTIHTWGHLTTVLKQ